MRLPITPRHFGSAGDRGSIPMALLAVIIVTGLMTVTLATTITQFRQARADRVYTSAIFPADAAIEQAKFRLNARRSEDPRTPAASVAAGAGLRVPCARLLVGGAPAPSCYVEGTPGSPEGEFEWYGQRIGTSRSWEVFSSGERDGARRSVRMLIEEDRRFFASAFAESTANFGNNNVADSFNSGRTGTPRWPTPGRLGLVGSNGTVETGGSSSTVDGIQIWNMAATGATNPTSKCSGQATIGLVPSQRACSEWARTNPINDAPYLQGFQQPRLISPDTSALVLAMDACRDASGNPVGGAFPELLINSSGVQVGPAGGPYVTVRSVPALQPFRLETGASNRFVGAGRGASLGAANHYCFSRVRISVDATIAAPANTLPAPDGHPTGAAIPSTVSGWTPDARMANPNDPVVMYVTGRVEIESGRRFNCIACTRPFPTTATTFAPPRSAALQIYLGRRTAPAPLPQFNVGNDARLGGTIHGPQAECGGSGSLSTAGTSADIYGSMVCNNIGGVGQWQFHYDESLAFIGNSVFTGQRWDER